MVKMIRMEVDVTDNLFPAHLPNGGLSPALLCHFYRVCGAGKSIEICRW